MTTLDDSIRQTITAYLARTNISARKFGSMALGDSGYVSSLKAGRSLGLDTADRVLQFMSEAPIGPTFRDEVEAFLSRTGMKPYKLGAEALDDPSFVTRLRSGASPQLRTVERVRRWMRDTHCPATAGPLGEGRPHGNRVPPQDDSAMFLSTRKAAALLTLSPRTLDRFRSSGSGPPYLRLGSRIVYTRDDLLEWAWSKRETPMLRHEQSGIVCQGGYLPARNRDDDHAVAEAPRGVSMSAARLFETLSAAALTESRASWTYRAVV